MIDDVEKILLKQLQLLQEESERFRDTGDLYDRPDMARMSEAMAQIASVIFRLEDYE